MFVLALLVLIPLAMQPIDAASALEEPTSTLVQVGDLVSLDAKGKGRLNGKEQVQVLTKMHLELRVSQTAMRRVSFDVLRGCLILNNSHYTVVAGVGIAGRSQHARFNTSVCFIFRINMTGPAGEDVSLTIHGGVKKTQEHGRVLIMRCITNIDGIEYVLWQVGRAHRTQT